MKAIGFNLGQRGDICMNTVVARQFKIQFPNYHLTLGIGHQYDDMAQLFNYHHSIDSVHIYETYDEWPSQKDLSYLNGEEFDIVFHGLPKHTSEKWWQQYHQTEEACLMNGLKKPINKKCNLNKYFETGNLKKYIAFAPFAGFYNKNNTKTLTLENAEKIVDLASKLGYTVIQLGGNDEPKLKNSIFLNSDYFNSVKLMLSCEFLIHTDTGIGWIASSYNFPCIGLYSNCYYSGLYVKNIQPINDNAIYIDNYNVNDINLEEIEIAIRNLK